MIKKFKLFILVFIVALVIPILMPNTNKNVKEQGLSLALLVTEGFLNGKNGACRVHGGGFAGTIQAYIKKEEAEDYSLLMQSIFGEGAVMKLNVRLFGAVKII